MYTRISLASIFFGLLLFAMIGCGGSGDTANPSSQTGTISLNLTDAPGDYKAVYVTIKEVHVHVQDNNESWKLISSPNKTFDLLTLRNGVRTSLGLNDLPVGTYTQIRLLLSSVSDGEDNLLDTPHPYGNYVLFNDNTTQELKVPSGLKNGIKLVGNFTITANTTTVITLDFDADKSVVKAGNSGQWLLKPVIKTILEEEYEDDLILSGTVRDRSNSVIEGVKVTLQEPSDSDDESDDYKEDEGENNSVQVLNSIIVAPKKLSDSKEYSDSQEYDDNGIEIEAASYSDINGSYRLQGDAENYILVAYKEGYLPFVQDINLSADTSLDITLDDANNTGTLTIDTSFTDGDDSAKVSIQQNVSGLLYEVISFNIASGFSKVLTLPEGNYTGVVSYEELSEREDINITNGGNVDWTINF